MAGVNTGSDDIIDAVEDGQSDVVSAAVADLEIQPLGISSGVGGVDDEDFMRIHPIHPVNNGNNGSNSHHHNHHHNHHHHHQYLASDVNLNVNSPVPPPPPIAFGSTTQMSKSSSLSLAGPDSGEKTAAATATAQSSAARIRFTYRSSSSAISGTPSGTQSVPSAVASHSSGVSTVETPVMSQKSGGPPPLVVDASGLTTTVNILQQQQQQQQQQGPGPAKWVTREIAALEFLLEGIPLQAERSIVHEGYMKLQQQQQQEVGKAMSSPSPKSPTTGTGTDGTENVAAVVEPTMPANQRQGRWWEKWIANESTQGAGDERNVTDVDGHDATGLPRDSHIEDLEGPDRIEQTQHQQRQRQHQQVVPLVQVPGRRLEGDQATRVQIPVSADKSIQTRQRSIARKAKLREWELQVAHGLLSASAGGGSGHERLNNVYNSTGGNDSQLQSQKGAQYAPPLLDGRMFFSAKESYPIQIFSLLRYEPKKEEAARRRQKLEARGGGGTQFFIMPGRDWRGISYRALLPGPAEPRDSDRWQHDRFVSADSSAMDDMVTPKNLIHEDDDDEQSEDGDEDTYIVGLLDDPGMTFGRHRNVMIGDRSTGPIVSSTIQFVKPQLLKADLNQQFRDRFDGWEPPKSQHKYIGAKVVNGLYTLMDPTFDNKEKGTGNDSITLLDDEQTIATTPTIGTSNSGAGGEKSHRQRQASLSSISTGGGAGGGDKETIRMPPSLTLSKIRSLKAQALQAAVKARLEISTVALAIIYFERLCLDCRVDKSNRRLSFAACLLLAIKINEAHVGVVHTSVEKDSSSTKTSHVDRIQSLIRPNKKSNSMFASLLEFFTQEWNLSLKHLFAAEWGVFAALQFRLQAKPSHVAFHFKRLMKALEWDPRRYLGSEMYTYWQNALADEEQQRIEREQRIKARQELKEEQKMLRLQQELEAANRLEKSSRSLLGQDEEEDKNINSTGEKSNINAAVLQIFSLNDTEGQGNDVPTVVDKKTSVRGKSHDRVGRNPFRSHTGSPVQRSKSGDDISRSPRHVARRRGSNRGGGLGNLLTMLSGGTGSSSRHGAGDGQGSRRGSPSRARSTERGQAMRLTGPNSGGQAVTAPSSPVIGLGSGGGDGGDDIEAAGDDSTNIQQQFSKTHSEKKLSVSTSQSIKKSISMFALSTLHDFHRHNNQQQQQQQQDEEQESGGGSKKRNIDSDNTGDHADVDFGLSKATSLDGGGGGGSSGGGAAGSDSRRSNQYDLTVKNSLGGGSFDDNASV